MILYLNAEVGGLSMQLKIKQKKGQNKNEKQTENNNNIKYNIIDKLEFEPRSLVWKAKIITTGVL